MKTNRILTAAATALTIAGLSATAASATTAPQIGVGVQGTGAGYVNGTWMTATIAQGGTQTWTFKVINTGTGTESISLLSSGAGGLYSGGVPAKQPASNIHNVISPSSVSLAPGASALVTDTVTIPANSPLGLIPGNAPGAPSLAFNTVWAYAGASSGGQISMAAATGLRQYITVVK